MLKEALKLIQNTATDAAGPQDLPSPSPHKHRKMLPGGVIDETTDEHPPRAHVANDIDSLSRWVAGDKDVVIWHDDSLVVAVLNDATFRDSRITMPLPIHPTFSALARCQGDLSQKALIDFLRLNLKKEIDAAAPTFISALRDVKFVNNAAGEATVQHGRESMGKRIDNSVTGADALPEEVTIRVPLWLHLEAIVEVDCALIIDTANATFRFGPKPGAVERAKVAGQKWLGDQLNDACPSAAIFFGSPEE